MAGSALCGDHLRRPTAAAFLRWAARGQSLACVHDLLSAATRGDPTRAEAAGRRLAEVGHSSGADLALGLGWGLAERGPLPHSL